MDSLKRLKKHAKAILKIEKENAKNKFHHVWKQMTTEERATYMGILNGDISLPEELVAKYDNNLYEILKHVELKMTEKYGK